MLAGCAEPTVAADVAELAQFKIPQAHQWPLEEGVSTGRQATGLQAIQSPRARHPLAAPGLAPARGR